MLNPVRVCGEMTLPWVGSVMSFNGEDNMIRVSDYIATYLAEYGITHVFLVPGGGAMYLNNSFARHPSIYCVCNHHEQACAIAAEGYARSSGRLAVVNVTSGPGSTNTLTGVLGQWTDSVPVLYISGQMKQETTTALYPLIKLRQLGDQEVNIVEIVRPITKWADTVRNPYSVKNMLEQAIELAITGRPGPVWLEIPLDVQASMIDESLLMTSKHQSVEVDEIVLKSKVHDALSLLQKSKRPLLLAGYGIRIAEAQKLLLEITEQINVPVVTSFNGYDLIPTDHPNFIGRIGLIGDRAGNFALQNADLLLSLGSRNTIRQVGYNWKNFAPKAKKVFVDIDEAELKKPTIEPDIAIHADVGAFLKEIKLCLSDELSVNWDNWLKWAVERKNKYLTENFNTRGEEKKVNPYYFIRELTSNVPSTTLIVAGCGTAWRILFKAGVVKSKQRIFWNSGSCAMGYDLPAAIGACFANPDRNVVCLAGEGSLQMNIQELQTVVHHKLPIKLFILNNGGYHTILQTQMNYFGGHLIGCNNDSGISFPNMKNIAAAYGIPYLNISEHDCMNKLVFDALGLPGPVICEVQLQEYEITPRVTSSRMSDGTMRSNSLENMYPFLNQEEIEANMIEPE